MHIILTDGRKLAVTIVRGGKFFNPATTGWETPFDPTKHMIPFASMDPTVGSVFGAVQLADIGTVLLQFQDAAALILSLDGSGAPVAVVDVWTLPAPVANPAIGAFLRA